MPRTQAASTAESKSAAPAAATSTAAVAADVPAAPKRKAVRARRAKKPSDKSDPSGPSDKSEKSDSSEPPAAPCPEWIQRIERLYDRAEALLAAWMGAFWMPPPGEAFAELSEDLPGNDAPSGTSGVAPAAGLYPPGLDAPLREPPALRDLSAALICLRRIQDARIALDRGLLDPSANPAAGGSPNGDEGNGIDINTLHTAVSRVLRPGSSAQAEDLDEDPLRD